MQWIEVEFQGRKVSVPALKHRGKLWFHWQGENHMVDLVGASDRSKAGGTGAKPGVIVAPMPGKITRVSVAKGDTVTAGQTLVVMEAMKMEYTLTADLAGVVAELPVKVSQQVSLGDLLVRVDEV